MLNTDQTQAKSPKMPVICVSGPDAGKFLQGQLTCDVLALQPGQSTLGAYCNIQGKVVSLFSLSYTDPDYFLQMPIEMLIPTQQELQKYAIFSKVTLSIVEQTVAITDDGQAILDHIPTIYLSTIGEFFPHDLNLPALGAVSFSKGCYRGQEIVARMQHRGNLKRGLYAFEIDYNKVDPGQIINTQDGTKAGTVVRTSQQAGGSATIGLAVLTHSLVAQQLYLNNTTITLVLAK